MVFDPTTYDAWAADEKLSAVDHMGAHNYVHRSLIPPGEVYARYAHPSGDNANDGKSWGTAKQTILAAYDSLPAAGGTIFIADNTNIGGEVSNQGIWLIGPNDPNWGSPPTGFRAVKPVEFIGVGSTNSIQFGFPSAKINGSAYDEDKPVIWLAGTGVPVRFRNLSAYYINGGIRMGIRSDNTSRDCNTALAWFENVNFGSYNSGVSKTNPKPTVDIGYAFWVWFNHCTFHAYPAAIDSDNRAAMLFKPEVAGNHPGLIEVTDCILAGGGIRYHAIGASSWSLRVTNLVMEHDGATAAPPAVRLLGSASYGQVVLNRIEAADAGAGSESAIVVASTLANNSIVVIDGPSEVEGPVQILGKYGWEGAWSPAVQKQSGFGPGGKLIGSHEAARRVFSPSAVIASNLVAQDVTTWSSKTGSATVTTGQVAPDGTTNAALLSSASGLRDRQPYRASRTIAVDDWMVVGCWIKGNGTSTISTGDIEMGFNPNNEGTFEDGTYSISLTLPFLGNEWQWVCHAKKVATVLDGTAELIFGMRCEPTKPRYYYAPLFLHIPASAGYTDDEVMEMTRHVSTYPDTATAGCTTTLRGQKLIAWGGLGVGNSATASTPGSVVKKIEVFDQTGASLGFIPVYSSIT